MLPTVLSTNVLTNTFPQYPEGSDKIFLPSTRVQHRIKSVSGSSLATNIVLHKYADTQFAVERRGSPVVPSRTACLIWSMSSLVNLTTFTSILEFFCSCCCCCCPVLDSCGFGCNGGMAQGSLFEGGFRALITDRLWSGRRETCDPREISAHDFMKWKPEKPSATPCAQLAANVNPPHLKRVTCVHSRSIISCKAACTLMQ